MTSRYKDRKKLLNEIGGTVGNIEINIYTNIPGKENTPIPFTRKLFHDEINSNGLKLKDNPFFTTDYRISDKIVNYRFDDRVRTLFEKNEFTSCLVEKDKSFSKKKPYERAEVNIRTLLQALFPTYYPVALNQTDTFSQMIESKLPSEKYVSSIFSYFKEIFKNEDTSNPSKRYGEYMDEYDIEERSEPDRHPFCYLDIDGSTYTVLKVVHLNDFINNPKYYEILTRFLDILKWKENQTKSNEVKIYKYKREIVDLMDRLVYDMNMLNNRYNFFNNLRTSEHDRYSGRYTSDTSLIDNIKKRTKKLFYSPYQYPDYSDKYFDTKTTSARTPNQNINEVFDELLQEIKNNRAIPDKDALLNRVNKLLKDAYNLQNYDKITSIDPGVFKAEFDKLVTDINSHVNRDVVSKFREVGHTILSNIKILNDIHLAEFKNEKKDLISEMQRINRKLERFVELTPEEQATYTAYKDAIDEKYDNYSEYIEFISPLFRNDSSSSSTSVVFDSKFSKSYAPVLSAHNKLVLETKVQEVYFGNETDVSKDIGEEVTQYFNTTHTKYSEFIQFIKKFTHPNREASNSVIRDMILDYIVGNSTNLKDFLTKIKDEDISGINDSVRLSYEEHNAGIIGAPRYEIQVYMDLMKGKLTKDDVENLGCYFKDKELVSTYYNTLYKNMFDNVFLFDDKLPVLTVPKKKKTDSDKTEKEDHTNSTTTEGTRTRGGGNNIPPQGGVVYTGVSGSSVCGRVGKKHIKTRRNKRGGRETKKRNQKVGKPRFPPLGA